MSSTLQLSFVERAGFGLDRALSVVAPKYALRRAQARAESVIRNAFSVPAYGTTRTSSLHSRSVPARVSPSQAILDHMTDLRDDARDLVRRDPHAAALARVLEENVVGTGLRPQARVTREATGLTQRQAETWNRACEEVFLSWAEDWADAAGMDTFWDFQRRVLRGWKVDGESFVHRVPVPLAAELGRPLVTSLELVEPERVMDPEQGSGTVNIKGGVEIGGRGQPIAYHVANQNPHESGVIGTFKTTRVRRYRNGVLGMLHVYRRDEPNQPRGVTLLAPTILTFRTLNKYLEAEMAAAAVAACWAVFIKTTSGAGASNPDPWATDGGAGGTDGGEVSMPVRELRPGLVEYLGQDESIESFANNRPGNTFAPFVERMLRGLSAGVGLPYELLVRDFSKTNYSSMRAALLETRRGFRMDQQTLVRKFCRPVWRLVITEAMERGLLPREPAFRKAWRERQHAMLGARWIAPGWGWVDPTKEIQASRDAIAAGLSTLADEAAGAGSDWRELAETRAQEISELLALEEQYELPRGTLSNLEQPGVPSAASPPGESSDDSDSSADAGDESADGEEEKEETSSQSEDQTDDGADDDAETPEEP